MPLRQRTEVLGPCSRLLIWWLQKCLCESPSSGLLQQLLRGYSVGFRTEETRGFTDFLRINGFEGESERKGGGETRICESKRCRNLKFLNILKLSYGGGWKGLWGAEGLLYTVSIAVYLHNQICSAPWYEQISRSECTGYCVRNVYVEVSI